MLYQNINYYKDAIDLKKQTNDALISNHVLNENSTDNSLHFPSIQNLRDSINSNSINQAS